MEERTLLAAVSFDEAFKTVDFEISGHYAGDVSFPIGEPTNYQESFDSNFTETGTLTFTGPFAGSGGASGTGTGTGSENYRLGPGNIGSHAFSYTGNIT